MPPLKEKNAFTRDELLMCGHGELFGHDGPQLPLPNMLMFDRISRIAADEGEYGKGLVIAEFDVDPEHWFFKCHFEGDPVMPGCLGLDALWQLVGFYMGWLGHKGKGRALGVEQVKFSGQVRPTDKKVTYRLDVRRVLALKLVMAVADGAVTVDDREIYTAKTLKLGLFQQTNAF